MTSPINTVEETLGVFFRCRSDDEATACSDEAREFQSKEV